MGQGGKLVFDEVEYLVQSSDREDIPGGRRCTAADQRAATILFQSIFVCATGSSFPDERCQDGVRISSRRFHVATLAANVAGPGNGISRADLMSRDHMPFQFPAMHTENGRDGLASGRHADKSESPGFITVVLLYHIRSFNAAKHFKNLAKVVPRNVARQITYADIHSLLLSVASDTDVSTACQTNRNDAGDGVLRLPMLSIANRLASRLHQAIIPSSQER